MVVARLSDKTERGPLNGHPPDHSTSATTNRHQGTVPLSGDTTILPDQLVSSVPQRDRNRTRRPKARAESQRIGEETFPTLTSPPRAFLKASKIAINVCIDSIRPPDSGHVIRNPGDGPVVVFITQQNNSDVIRNVTSAFPSDWRSKKPPTTYTHQRKPGDSYILILNDGHRCEIEGVPAVRYSGPRKHIEEAVEAGRAI